MRLFFTSSWKRALSRFSIDKISPSIHLFHTRQKQYRFPRGLWRCSVFVWRSGDLSRIYHDCKTVLHRFHAPLLRKLYNNRTYLSQHHLKHTKNFARNCLRGSHAMQQFHYGSLQSRGRLYKEITFNYIQWQLANHTRVLLRELRLNGRKCSLRVLYNRPKVARMLRLNLHLIGELTFRRRWLHDCKEKEWNRWLVINPMAFYKS